MISCRHHKLLTSSIGLYRRFAPPAAADPEDPHYHKEQVLYSLIFLSVVVGFIPLAASIQEMVRREYWAILAVSLSAYLSGLAIFFMPFLSYRIRSLWVCAAIYAMGLSIILSVGPLFATREWLFAFSILAAIMLGWTGALVSVAINLLTLIAIGVLVGRGFWSGLPIPAHSPVSWSQTVLDLFFLNLVIAVVVAYIFQRLERSDRRAKEAAILLLKERDDLIRSRRLLKEEVQERKRTQDKITALRAREKEVLDSIAAGILIVSRADKSVVYANSTALSMLGAGPNALIGKASFCPLDRDSCPVIDLGQGMDCGERELRRVDGQGLSVLKTAVPITYDGRECLLETFVDIADRKRLESQLAQAQKMEAIGTLAGGIAHDFNNILSAIIGFTELSVSRTMAGDKTRSHLEKVLGASHRAKDLVTQLLSFSRKNEPERTPIRIEPVILEGLKLLRPTLPASVHVQTDLQERSGLIKANPAQVGQVLMNLCLNAVEAMSGRPGVLGVELSDLEVREPILGLQGSLPPGRYAVLTVTDTGRGISPKNLKRIFEPFYTTKETGQGPGMGLAVVHGIVASHGGLVVVESETDLGSRFSVYFPALREEDLAAEEAEDSIPFRSWGRILMVEAGELLTPPAPELFESLGYHLTVFPSAPAAWEAFEGRPDDFDLLIIDLTLPGSGGADLARKASALKPDLPIILCTGQDCLVSENEALSLGVARFISKPLSFTQTADLVRDLLSETNRRKGSVLQARSGSGGP